MMVRNNMKFGIDIPATCNKAVELDRINGITYWKYATKKKTNNAKFAFKFIYDGSKLPIRFKNITRHLIFDVNFDFTKKAIYVGGGHLTQAPESVS